MKEMTSTFCDLFTSERQLCLTKRYLIVSMAGYCSDENLTPYVNSEGNVGLSYEQLVNLSDEGLSSLFRIATTNRHENQYFYYHICLALAILYRTDSDKCEPLLNRLINLGVDPYYEITNSELERMIEYGELDAYMYTLRQVLHNPNIDLSHAEVELTVYRDLVETLRNEAMCDRPNSEHWPEVADKFITERSLWVYHVNVGNKEYNIEVKDLSIYELINQARSRVTCDKSMYRCTDEPECTPCTKPKERAKKDCKEPKCVGFRITVCSRCRREKCIC